MPGNSKRRGAVRRTTKGNPTAGSGGRRRRGLEGRGPTPKAEDRVAHKAYRKDTRKGGRGAARKGGRAGGRAVDSVEWVFGRNAVVEALRAHVPATAVYVADAVERDDRLTEALATAAEQGLSVLEVTRPELDRLTGARNHQGLSLKVPPYSYADADALVERAREAGETPLVVVLDGITDPRNLGAIVRSAAAFGAHGVVVPARRSAGMTAAAWKTSAGTAARVPVARVTNLTRQLQAYQQSGLTVAGLAADGDLPLSGLDVADQPLVLVVGSEGRGIGRLVGEQCDVRVSVEMTTSTESLNASVAAGVALYEIARRRATA